MLRYGVKDRSVARNLFILESAILDVIMKTFVRSLLNDEVRKKTIRGLFTAERFLRGLCSLAKNADKFKKEFQKLMKEENKTRELKFYKDMMQRFMPQDKIEAMLINYWAKSIFIDWMQSNLFDENSHQLKYKRPQTILQSTFVKSMFLRSSTNIENLLPIAFIQFKAVFYSPQPCWNRVTNKNSFYKSPFKDLSALFTSKNLYINEIKVWTSGTGALCVKYDETRHVTKDCHGPILSAWEQSYLRSIVFENSPQVNFCSAGYEAYDENVLSYEDNSSPSTSGNLSQYHSESFFFKFESFTSEIVNFVTCEIADNIQVKDFILTSFKIASIRSTSVDAFYEEKSSLNKRFHLKFSAPGLEKEKAKKKEQRQIEIKKTDSILMMSMFNDAIETYDKSISIRQILKDNKVDMSLLDFMTWSPKTCREMKRLAIKIVKKRAFKVTFNKISKVISNSNSKQNQNQSLRTYLEMFLFTLNLNLIFQSRFILPPLNSIVFDEQSLFYPNISISTNVQFSSQTQNAIQYQFSRFLDQTIQFQMLVQSNPQSTIMDLSGGKVLNITTNANCHIWFLSSLKKMTKAFRIECII